MFIRYRRRREFQKALQANYVIQKIYIQEGSIECLKKIKYDLQLIPIISVKEKLLKKFLEDPDPKKFLL